MSPIRLEVSPTLRRLMAYPRFHGERPRLLVLRSGYWLDEACLNAAAALGWTAADVEVSLVGAMSREKVGAFFEKLIAFKPDFVLSINLGGMDVDGLFSRFLDDLAIPHATWFVDDPRTILMGSMAYGTPSAVAFTWDPAYEAYLEACGFPEVHTLPLAVDATLFNGPLAGEATLPPSFVGNSMVDFAAREWGWFDGQPALRQQLERAFAAGRVTREHFGEGLGAILGPEIADALDVEATRHCEMACFIEGTKRLRRDLVSCLQDTDLQTHGDDGWHGIAAYPRSFVSYREDLPAHYRDTLVNLNVTSIQMPHAVNQRVFDCPASGGFLLTDHQTQLETLFDVEKEVVTYSSFGECREKLAYYRRHAATRRAIVAAAQKRVLGEHCYTHRLEKIGELLKARFSH